MNDTINPLGNLPPEEFLRNYWQKKVLVVRQAFPNFESPISAEELAGLSCEEDVNSRIILEKDGEHPWFPIFGPMDEDTFSKLPKTHWTLVVNDLEKYLPELAWIIDQFRFIPEWRFDDLMSSYAADQGSVGPHYDLYDVFIIQGKGKRRWQISTKNIEADNQIKETPLRILENFEAEEEWILEPGDMIYIPPNIAHHGVSINESISYSVGYRAISHSDLVNDFIGYITQNLAPQLTYQDPDLKLQTHSNEITQDALERVSSIFKKYLNPQHPELLKWFGRYSSDTKTDIDNSPEQQVENIDELVNIIDQGHILKRNPSSRFVFSRQGDTALLFIDGEEYSTSIEFAENICDSRDIDINNILKSYDNSEKELLVQFHNHGQIYIS